MHNFKELKVWKDSMILGKDIYFFTKAFPSEERFGITSQLRRSVVSIPSNISEGAGRSSKKEFCHFLDISIGSSFELETQVLLSQYIGYLESEVSNKLLKQITSIQKMLIGLKSMNQ